MASIKRRRGSQLWTCFYRDASARQHCRSTGTADRKLAQQIAMQYEQSARAKRTLRQFSRVLSDMHELINGQSVGQKTLRTFVHEWLELKRPETAPSTLSFYTGSATKFIAFLGEKADEPLSSLLKADLVAYRNTLSANLAPKTVNHDLTLVRMLFRAARRDNLIDQDPSEFVEAVRRTPEGQSRRAFTLEEIAAIVSVADPEWRSMILFGLYTGQRLSDVASLTWANIDLEKAELRLVTRKTGKRIILPLAGPLLRHLEALPSSDQLDCPLHARAAHIVSVQGRTGTLCNQFGNLLAQAGLREKKSHQALLSGRSARRKGGELSFHCLRHSTTSLLHAAGIPAAVAQAYIGHDSTAVHELYIHVGIQSLQQAANALPEL